MRPVGRMLLILVLCFHCPTTALSQVESQIQAGFAVVSDFNKKDFKTLMSIAQSGPAWAQFEVAMAYSGGNGTKKDYAEAVKWFRVAADQGFAPAQWVLGLFFRDGRGVQKNPSEAVNWLRKAAEQGLPGAQCDLGTMLYLAEGIPADYPSARVWLDKAAKAGHLEAQTNLGSLCGEGIGGPKDYVREYAWWLLGARSGERIEDLKHNLSGLSEEMSAEDVAKARQFAFDSLNAEVQSGPSGANLQVKEVTPRGTYEGKSMLAYDFKATGFPEGKGFSIWMYRGGQASQVLWRGFKADENGKLRCSPPPDIAAKSYTYHWCRCGFLDDLHMVVEGIRRGEPLTVGAVSLDGTVRSLTKTTPLPIEAAEGSCHLRVALLSLTGDIFSVTGTGFSPSEDITIRVEGETYKLPASTEGPFGEVLFLPKAATQTGPASYNARGKSCLVEAKFDQGEAAARVM